MKLMVPLCGASSRFNVTRPKWLLTMPSGKLMIEEGLEGLGVENVDEIILIVLDRHLKEHIPSSSLKSLIEQSLKKPTRILALENETKNQPETIATGLKLLEEDMAFFVKDCDNRFEQILEPKNCVSYLDLNNIDFVNARNKSYITLDNLGVVKEIIEKKVISNTFCVGGYGFQSSKQFCEAYEALKLDINELYVSHIIFHMIMEGSLFEGIEVSNYKDWGTIKEYLEAQQETVTIFCDFDGVLVKNSSKFSSIPWSYDGIDENLSYVANRLSRSKFSKLVITTSRPFSEQDRIIEFLGNYGIKAECVLCDLPHCKRILINDFSSTNRYPSAIGISVPRDTINLEDYL